MGNETKHSGEEGHEEFRKAVMREVDRRGDIFYHKSTEKCTNGEDHDFSGDMVYFTSDGYETADPDESSSGSVLCRRCGIDAMSYSMRYGP